MTRGLRNWLIASAASMALAAPVPALATFALQVLENGITCFDNTGCDGLGVANNMIWSTSVPGITIDVNTSFTNTPGGSPDSHLDLNWVVNTIPGDVGGTVHILATATGFMFPSTGGISTFSNHVGGTGIGTFSVTAQSWVDFGNVLFGMGGPTPGALGPFNSSPIGGADSMPLLIADVPFSITELLTITVGANSSTTGDSQVVIPEPSTLLLLAAGLFGFGAYLRRRA